MWPMQDAQGLDTEGAQHGHQQGNMHYITCVTHVRVEEREGWVKLMEIIMA